MLGLQFAVARYKSNFTLLVFLGVPCMRGTSTHNNFQFLRVVLRLQRFTVSNRHVTSLLALGQLSRGQYQLLVCISDTSFFIMPPQ